MRRGFPRSLTGVAFRRDLHAARLHDRFELRNFQKICGCNVEKPRYSANKSLLFPKLSANGSIYATERMVEVNKLNLCVPGAFAMSALLAISSPLPVTASVDGDVDGDVELPGSPTADLTFRFVRAGLDPIEAGHLSELLTFGPDAVSSSSGCQYYMVTTVWCAGGTRWHQRTNVGTMCIEDAHLNLCANLSCMPGMQSRFKITTASSGCPSGITGAACAYVDVMGPLVANSMSLCNSLSDCKCWPMLSCSSRECVPVVEGLASACPDCAPPAADQ